jgi:hypothetical protein
MLKIVIGSIELVYNTMSFMGLIIFGVFWIIWAITIELFYKLRDMFSKIDSTIVICFAALIYIEMALFFLAKAQLN